MAEVYLLSGDDRDKLQQLLKERGQVPHRPTPEYSPPPAAPEVYIARIPEGGIPALVPGTGTGASIEYDHPGCLYCDIYKVVLSETEDHDWDLMPISGLGFPVFNITERDLLDGWTTVARDKGGSWLSVGSQPSNYFYQVLTRSPANDMDGNTYSCLANPGTFLPDGSVTEALNGVVTDGKTVVVLDPTHQVPAWEGDWIVCEPVGAGDYNDALTNYTSLFFSGTLKFVRIVHRAPQGVTFDALLQLTLGSTLSGWVDSVSASVTINGITKLKTVYASPKLAVTDSLPVGVPCDATYFPDKRKFIITGMQCEAAA